VVGAAWAALDEFEDILRTRKTVMPPIMPRFQHNDFQRAFGEATALADAAEGVLMSAGRLYMYYCRRWAEDGTPYSVAENIRLWGMVQQAGRLACESIEVVFTAAGSSAARRGQRIQQYYRDAAMYRGHVAAQRQTFATYIGRAQFGLPMGLWGRL
jgi:3-hydroxy-9,10-secoandrosta-1,3,5(10)-triene-9,17-dione monooxygenase